MEVGRAARAMASMKHQSEEVSNWMLGRPCYLAWRAGCETVADGGHEFCHAKSNCSFQVSLATERRLDRETGGGHCDWRLCEGRWRWQSFCRTKGGQRVGWQRAHEQEERVVELELFHFLNHVKDSSRAGGVATARFP